MNDNTNVVLACIDGSTLSEAVCDYATWIAQSVEAPLTLLHVIDHHRAAETPDLSGSIGLGAQEQLIEEMTSRDQQQNKLRLQKGKALVAASKERAARAGCILPTTCMQYGSLIDALVEREDTIRVMVIGARGRTHEDQSDQIGLKLEAMIRSVHRPILVAYGAFKKPQNIMVAYDGSEAADKAVDMVAWSPLYKGLTCHLVYVSNKQSADGVLEKAADKLRAAEGVELVVASLQGRAEDALVEYQGSHDIDMTVMGAFSHIRLHDILLGSFTHKMLLKTKKPLLLLR
jgi:nucleotide-binding universal stress UspA family protein